MSSSGGKQLQMNPLERALSTDVNRLQEFMGANFSTVLQALFDNGTGFDDVWAGSQFFVNSTQGNPAFAEVITGIVFVPTNASAASAILGGVVAMLDPDVPANPDDSQYKLIIDPGTNSTLTPVTGLTANASGSIRIDVLECARVAPDNVIETDNRDVYNPVTGTFTAVTLNKVTQAQLQYRIRVGTAGAGFPGTVAGWMPICVMSVPTGTTTWDTVTIWDVRPMLEDRVKQPLNAAFDMPRGRNEMYYTFQNASGFLMSGLAECGYVKRFLGGRLGRGSPGADSSGGVLLNTIDLTDTANQEASMSTAAGLYYVYLLTPFGLPKWARFTDAAVGVRQARSPRGIPIVSAVGPAHSYCVPSAPITFPAVFGFNGASTAAGACIAGVYFDGAVFHRQTCARGKVDFDITAIPGVSGGAFTGSLTTFIINENTHVPAGVRRIHCVAACLVTVTTGNQFYDNPSAGIQLAAGDTTAIATTCGSGTTSYNDSGSNRIYETWFDFWLSLPNNYGSAGTGPVTPVSYDIPVNFDTATLSTGSTFSAPGLRVIGWEF